MNLGTAKKIHFIGVAGTGMSAIAQYLAGTGHTVSGSDREFGKAGAATVRIHGRLIRPAATIHTVGGLSAHGDQADLLRWYGSFAAHPPVCLVHGEWEPANALRQSLERLGARVFVPVPGVRLDLSTMTMRRPAAGAEE